MHERIKEIMDQWTKKWLWITERINKWINELITEWIDEWINR